MKTPVAARVSEDVGLWRVVQYPYTTPRTRSSGNFRIVFGYFDNNVQWHRKDNIENGLAYAKMEYMLTFLILNVYFDKTQPQQIKYTCTLQVIYVSMIYMYRIL